MKRLLMTAAALAALAVPTLSMAQPRGGGDREVRQSQREVRQGQREVRQDRRELRQERREAMRDGRISRGDRREIGEARRELRQDQRELRRDQRDLQRDRRDYARDRRDDRWDRRDDRWDGNRWNGQRFDGRRDDNRWSDNRWNDRRYDNRWNDNRRYDDGRRWSRNDPNWWRGRPEFRGYVGPRSGYWFAPSYGYVRVEPRYYGRVWRRGDYVPVAYRSYYVPDPWFYGLAAPPPGYQWVYLGGDIVLMSLATGLIAEMLTGVF